MNSQETGPTGPSSADDLVVTRTYLTIDDPAWLRPSRPPGQPASLVRLSPCDVPTFRRLYHHVGAAWRWHDRDAWDDATLSAHLDRPTTSIYRVEVEPTGGAPTPEAGMLELNRHDDGSTEIVYLGLTTDWMGRGIGSWLVAEAVSTAFASGAERVWLHTCTLDADAALPNYLARGFQIDRTETYTVPRTV